MLTELHFLLKTYDKIGFFFPPLFQHKLSTLQHEIRFLVSGKVYFCCAKELTR